MAVTRTQGWKAEETWFVACEDAQEPTFASPIRAGTSKCPEQHLQQRLPRKSRVGINTWFSLFLTKGINVNCGWAIAGDGHLIKRQ